ncbi:1,4-dihydroxy-2-naphthoate polyprenyltransferase, partial [Halolamina salina]
MSSNAEPTRAKAWVMAARPQTMPAAISPVLVGV